MMCERELATARKTTAEQHQQPTLSISSDHASVYIYRITTPTVEYSLLHSDVTTNGERQGIWEQADRQAVYRRPAMSQSFSRLIGRRVFLLLVSGEYMMTV